MYPGIKESLGAGYNNQVFFPRDLETKRYQICWKLKYQYTLTHHKATNYLHEGSTEVNQYTPALRSGGIMVKFFPCDKKPKDAKIVGS